MMTNPSVIGNEIEKGLVPGAKEDIVSRERVTGAINWVKDHMEYEVGDADEDAWLSDQIMKHAEYIEHHGPLTNEYPDRR